MPGKEKAYLKQIVSGLIARDDKAWREFMDMLGPVVNAACRRTGLNNDGKEDVAQSVVVKLLEGDSRVLRKLKITTRDSFFGWLKVITLRTALDVVRGSGNRERREFNWAVGHWRKAVEEALPAEEIEQAVMVEKAVSGLSESDQALFRLDYNGLRDREIAEILGAKLGTVQQRLSRMRQRIRSILTGGEGEK